MFRYTDIVGTWAPLKRVVCITSQYLADQSLLATCSLSKLRLGPWDCLDNEQLAAKRSFESDHESWSLTFSQGFLQIIRDAGIAASNL